MPNYSLENLPERAAKALEENAPYVRLLLEQYRGRRQLRRASRMPAMALCGMGRAGKDTAAEYLCQRLGLQYPGSASQMIAPLLASIAETTVDVVFQERHQNRIFWIHACHAVREADLGLLAKMCLGAGDVVVGPRGKDELKHLTERRIVTLTLWIDNPNVPVDPTTEYTIDDCDLVIRNAGSLHSFHAKLDVFVDILLRGKTFTENDE